MHETISVLRKCGNNLDNQLSNLQDYVMSLSRSHSSYGNVQNFSCISHFFLTCRSFFNVSTLHHLNVIGRSGIATLDIDVQSLIKNQIAALAREVELQLLILMSKVGSRIK